MDDLRDNRVDEQMDGVATGCASVSTPACVCVLRKVSVSNGCYLPF